MSDNNDGENERRREKLKTSPWGWIHFLDILECSGPLSLIWTPAQEIITSLLKTIHFVFPIQLMTMRTSRPLTLLVINSYLILLLLYNFHNIFIHPMECTQIYDGYAFIPLTSKILPFPSNGQFLFSLNSQEMNPFPWRKEQSSSDLSSRRCSCPALVSRGQAGNISLWFCILLIEFLRIPLPIIRYQVQL